VTFELPLVTVGITTYNASNSVERAINSALAQTYRPIEITLVDDCSTDDTLDRVQDIDTNGVALRIFPSLANCGVAVARNTIIENARGEFVVFFDDDDISHNERVIAQYQRIVEYERKFANGAPVICHTVRRITYPSQKERTESTIGLSINKSAPSGPVFAKRILLGSPLEDGYGSCPTCCQMARLETYLKLGGFDPSLRRGEDTDFNIRLALAGGHFVGVDQPLVFQTMTKTSDKSLREEHLYWRRIMEKHRSFMEAEGQFEFAVAWLDLKQSWLERKKTKFVLILLKLSVVHPILTFRRLWLAIPNFGSNNEFSRFHFSKTD